MPNDLARVPKITTLSRPAPRVLLSARFEVQRNAFIRTAMEKFKGDKDADAAAKLAGELQSLLAEHLDASSEDLSETAKYLADEYLQIGDAVLIVSRDTGMPIAKVTADDMWQPNLVPRDNGGMATPLARLRPELEGFLVRWVFERAREEKIVEELANRVATTDFLAKNGDPRLYATTRAGREIILEDLRSALPDLIPTAVGGSLGGFLRLLLNVGEPTDKSGKSYPGFKAYARINTPMMDHKSRNLFFDIIGTHRSLIATQWGREIARTISRLAHADQKVCEQDFPNLAEAKGLWVAPPEEAAAMRSKFAPYCFVIPIEGASTFCVKDPCASIGNLVLGKTDIVQREVHDRWEIAATLDYDLYIEWSAISPVHFTDLPAPEVSAQIVGV